MLIRQRFFRRARRRALVRLRARDCALLQAGRDLLMALFVPLFIWAVSYTTKVLNKDESWELRVASTILTIDVLLLRGFLTGESCRTPMIGSITDEPPIGLHPAIRGFLRTDERVAHERRSGNTRMTIFAMGPWKGTIALSK